MVFKVLLVDDNENEAFFFQRALDQSGVSSEVAYVEDGPSGLERLTTTDYNCIFLDYHLPGLNGLEILKKIRSQGIDTPVIMLTGQKDDMIIVELMRAGANDYISKKSLNPESLRLSIENTHRLYLIKKEKVFAEEALRISEAKLSEAQKIAKVGNWEYDFVQGSSFYSKEAYSVLEHSSGTNFPTFRNFIRKVLPEDLKIIRKGIENLKNQNHYDITFRVYASDKSIKHLNAIGRKIYSSNGTAEKIIGTVQDVTILKNALNETKKATAKRKATSVVFTIAILIFLMSEFVLDPIVDSFTTTSFILALSFKGSIALGLMTVEGFLGKILLGRLI